MTTKVLEPDEAHGLLAAYAINAVDESERRAVDAYLDEHAEARTDVEAYHRAAQWLQSPDGPRSDVWDRINSHITGHEEPVRVVPLAGREPHRRRRFPRPLAAVAVASAIVGLVAAITVRENQPSVPGVTAGARARRQSQEALRTPGAQRGTITSDDKVTTANVVVTPSGAGYVLSFVAPHVASGSHYRLFALTPSGPVQLAELGKRPPPIQFQTPPGTTSLVISTDPPTPTTSVAQTSNSPQGDTTKPTTPPPENSPTSPNVVPASPRPGTPLVPQAPTRQVPPVPIPTGVSPTTLPSLPHLTHQFLCC